MAQAKKKPRPMKSRHNGLKWAELIKKNLKVIKKIADFLKKK
jgi:hypothetical protein